ncbi:MAG: peptidoglycan-binding protein [Myxacorys chilensis ATA2-1-KO14]|jgi:peptidoglycan hydrolase-like protein with peptidoglycan-binding domain|nr:peptidoglycan-binding protein [Myxacorys chilensis ATA2-1-KO14]
MSKLNRRQFSKPAYLNLLSLLISSIIFGVAQSAMAQFEGDRIPDNSDRSAPIYPSDGVLQEGDRGAAVTNLQQQLAALGYYRGSIDGVFGQDTTEAVLRFQRDRNLIADGIVGTQVYQALGISPSPSYQPSGRQLGVGDSGADVEELQRRLANLGYFNTSVTGYYGSATQDAVTRFQQDRQLAITGSADAQTLSALGISSAVGGDANERYVVIVPKNDDTILAKVRQYAPTAFLSGSRLGDYVQAGTFPSREAADRQTRLLRSQGLDARVTYP